MLTENGTILKIWKTIKIGTGLKGYNDFLRAFRLAGLMINSVGQDILHQPVFKASQTETSVDLVILSPNDLGFENKGDNRNAWKTSYKEIVLMAKNHYGLELCTLEVAPQLRLQYTSDSKKRNSVLVVATELVKLKDGNYLFHLGLGLGVENAHHTYLRDSKQYLVALIANKKARFPNDTNFVFCLPKKDV